MNKIFLSISVLITLLSCSKEDNPGGNTESYFTEGSWTQKDTIVGSVGTSNTAELSTKGDSIIITNFVTFNTRLAFLKGTTSISSINISTPASYPNNYNITDLTITKISATEFRYSFNESWAVYNPQSHRGSMKKN